MRPYWLEEPLLKGSNEPLKDGEILIIGSGITGASCAYWLQKVGFRNLTLTDCEPESAATCRNCGHILFGTVESMQALVALHGAALAEKIWRFSVELCLRVRETVESLSLSCDYQQLGYYCLAINEAEDLEIRNSVSLLNKMGLQSDYISPGQVRALGFRNILGARYEKGSAQAHPVKFRNGLMKFALKNGLKYRTRAAVTGIEEGPENKIFVYSGDGKAKFDAVIIAANAYSPLFSGYFRSRKLVEPFRGQIIVSQPVSSKLPLSVPHSFDHGYEYALGTPDNRLMIGGWRNHTESGETGTYDLAPNPGVEQGLKSFVKKHYSFSGNLNWEYSWSGIMAGSASGFPFIGPTDVPNIFACVGYTGHGFSWAHGSARLLADIISGKPLPDLASLFRPETL